MKMNHAEQMSELFKAYFNAKLAKYITMYKDNHQATVGAKFALEDLMLDIKRISDNATNEEVRDYLAQEVEDAVLASQPKITITAA
jgi:predicted secreted Zn-dependent protease